MYIPKIFEEQRVEALHGLMRAYPLATLVVQGADGLQANHLPLFLREDLGPCGTLVGHIAKGNPLAQDLDQTSEVLMIFQGPQSYITPSWYATKQEGGKVVPTWNYVAVHASGQAKLIHDHVWLRKQLATLTAEHESSFEAPWSLEDAPEEFVEHLLAAIVGIEITLTHLCGKWKVSQNQPYKNQEGVIEGLRSIGSDSAIEMARCVEERSK